jgi:hypothetical protein
VPTSHGFQTLDLGGFAAGIFSEALVCSMTATTLHCRFIIFQMNLQKLGSLNFSSQHLIFRPQNRQLQDVVYLRSARIAQFLFSADSNFARKK